jgi:hypothetical protein
MKADTMLESIPVNNGRPTADKVRKESETHLAEENTSKLKSFDRTYLSAK